MTAIREAKHRTPNVQDLAPIDVRRSTFGLEPILVVLAGLGLFGLYVWAGRYWIDLVDEGYFLYLASRVHGGDLPYRDFDTYYTPGVFYLYAAAFDLFGVSVVPVRILMAGMRAVCAVLLYGLTRRVAPWPFAVLPFLLIAAVDPIPVFPEPHPAWSAMVATLLVMEVLARHHAGPRLGWVALAGAAVGLAFFFKQNAGAFAALAVGGYLLLRDREAVGRLLLGGRFLFAGTVVLAESALLWPGLDALVAVVIWLPLPATLGILVWDARRRSRPGWTAGLGEVVAEGLLAGVAFVGVTVLWLIPLTLALGPRETPFGLFVGAVNQGALLLSLEPPPRAARELALAAIWLPLGVAGLAWATERGRRTIGGQPPAIDNRPPSNRLLADVRGQVIARRSIIGAAVAASLLIPAMPTVTRPWEPLTDEPIIYPWLSTLDARFSTLYIYVPALGAWAGLAALLRERRAESREWGCVTLGSRLSALDSSDGISWSGRSRR